MVLVKVKLLKASSNHQIQTLNFIPIYVCVCRHPETLLVFCLTVNIVLSNMLFMSFGYLLADLCLYKQMVVIFLFSGMYTVRNLYARRRASMFSPTQNIKNY